MMKKLVLTVLTLGFLVMFTSSTMANLLGSAHDFTSEAWSGNKICDPCHLPHKADTTVVNAPLWNHDLTSQSPYGIYSSSTLTANVGQPDGISKLCLSCHDGTVALDSFGGEIGSTMLTSGDKGYLGTDLSGSHPIAFVYDDSLAASDGKLNAPSSTNSGLGGTIAGDMLFDGKMECATCHDPHQSDESQAAQPMLVKSNYQSGLCLTCHNK